MPQNHTGHQVVTPASLPSCPAEERRQSTRFPKEPGSDFAVFWQTAGEETLVEVHDESLGGLCLVLSRLDELRIGAEVSIVYQRTLLQGIVRHIEPQPDGTFHVGFECRR